MTTAMADPLAEVVTLLQPSAAFSKLVTTAGPWRVRRTEEGRPFYCVVLEGGCRLAVHGREPLALRAGDFVLIPAAYEFETASLELAAAAETLPTELTPGEFRLGRQDGPADTRTLLGYCTFGSPDANLLVSLLPELVHVRSEPRLTTLVQLVRDETHARRPGRSLVLARLVEVLLLEALRSTVGVAASPGLVRGLADEHLAAALRRMHESPDRAWTVPQLAREAALSRSVFFERFQRAVGVAPMAYLLGWRMALAKDLLRRGVSNIAEVAGQVGYGSASAFSVAFSRQVGMPPAKYARA